MKAHLDRRQEDPVTHLSIDRQPEAVKQFFATLALTPEGSVVEMNGRPVAHMLPAEAPPAASGSADWTPRQNHRRCELVDKKFAGGLTPAEAAELAQLTAGLRRFVGRVVPVPLDEVRRLHQQLLEKATAADSRA